MKTLQHLIGFAARRVFRLLLVLSAATMGVVAADAADTLPWLRPYIDGEEVVGTTLYGRYSADEGADVPVIRWEKSDSRTGKPVLVRQGRDADTLELKPADAGKYVRIVVGAGTKQAVTSPWIGPTLTKEQAESIVNRFDPSRPYPANVAALQSELKEKLKDAVYLTVDSGDLHGSPYAMVRNERRALPEDLRPIIQNGKVYFNEACVRLLFDKEMPEFIMEEAGGQKAYEIGAIARELNMHLWLGDEHKAPTPNFRLAHMGEGLVVFSPSKEVFSPVADRDLINEAVNQLFDYKANDEQLKWFRDAKFGLFLHWNPSSILEREISWERQAARPKDSASGHKNVVDFTYDSVYRRFNPKMYDPAKWMAVAKKSGMKYAVLTAKHHDGFCNFPSIWDTYTVTRTPYGKDIVGQFAAAVHAAGLKLGFYYSGRDWIHPYYRQTSITGISNTISAKSPNC